MSTCPKFVGGICELASWLADKPVPVDQLTCLACERTAHPRDLNPVTKALAGIEHSDVGPGTTLENLISWFVRKPPNCSCPDRVDVMNAWGAERCLKELPTILSWLRESALDNNIPYSERVISVVVKTMLKMYRLR